MDTVHLAILAAGLALVLGGARLIWCGHHRRLHGEQRHGERRMTRRGPGRRLS